MRTSIISLSFAAILGGLVFPFSLAAPRAAEEMVMTPVGMLPTSSIHQVPEGARVAHVGEDVHIIDAAGKVLHVTEKPLANASKVKARDLDNGWVAYAWWYNTGTSPISSFATTWSVPSIPETYTDGQVIFLFNSIEPADYNAILQPVLQWGVSAVGGGSYWALASWYIIGNSEVWVTSLVPTDVGTVLNGLITLTGQNGTSFDYETEFTGISATSLTITDATELVWATETLEVYGVTETSDFPTGSTVFSGINIALSSGPPATTVSWSTVSDLTDGLTTTVDTDGYSDAQITITY